LIEKESCSAHHKHRTWRVTHHALRRAADKRMFPVGVTVRGDDDESWVHRFRHLAQRLMRNAFQHDGGAVDFRAEVLAAAPAQLSLDFDVPGGEFLLRKDQRNLALIAMAGCTLSRISRASNSRARAAASGKALREFPEKSVGSSIQRKAVAFAAGLL
jgi:hypothetical protein